MPQFWLQYFAISKEIFLNTFKKCSKNDLCQVIFLLEGDSPRFWFPNFRPRAHLYMTSYLWSSLGWLRPTIDTPKVFPRPLPGSSWHMPSASEGALDPLPPLGFINAAVQPKNRLVPVFGLPSTVCGRWETNKHHSQTPKKPQNLVNPIVPILNHPRYYTKCGKNHPRIEKIWRFVKQ